MKNNSYEWKVYFEFVFFLGWKKEWIILQCLLILLLMTLNAACKGPELISDDEELYYQYLIVSQFKTERRCQYLVDSAVTGAFFKTLPDCCIFAKVVCDVPTYAYMKLFSLLKLFVMFQYMFTSRYDITQPHVLYKCTCK